MKRFTFDKFDSKDHGRPVALGPDTDIGELPIELIPSKDAIIRQAGFDPADVGDHIGVFWRPWQNHPKGSVIVANDWNFLAGEPFAISREQV